MAPPEENNLLSQELRAAEAEAAEFKDELFHGELPDSTESNLRFLCVPLRVWTAWSKSGVRALGTHHHVPSPEPTVLA